SPLRRFADHSAILPPIHLSPSQGLAAAAQRGTAAPGCYLPSFRRNLSPCLRFWLGSYFHSAQQRHFKAAGARSRMGGLARSLARPCWSGTEKTRRRLEPAPRSETVLEESLALRCDRHVERLRPELAIGIVVQVRSAGRTAELARNAAD